VTPAGHLARAAAQSLAQPECLVPRCSAGSRFECCLGVLGGVYPQCCNQLICIPANSTVEISTFVNHTLRVYSIKCRFKLKFSKTDLSKFLIEYYNDVISTRPHFPLRTQSVSEYAHDLVFLCVVKLRIADVQPWQKTATRVRATGKQHLRDTCSNVQ